MTCKTCDDVGWIGVELLPGLGEHDLDKVEKVC